MTPPPLWSVPVLMYHEIRESAKATWPKLAVSPDAFRAQLAYLSDAGYTTLTASALASLLAKGGSCQHPQLDQLPAAQVRNELYASKAELEDRLAIPVPGLAYPYGYSNARVREMAQAVGYDFGYAVRNTMTSTGTALFRLPRLTVHNPRGCPSSAVSLRVA